MVSKKALARTLGGLERSINISRNQGSRTNELEAKKAEILKQHKDLKANAPDSENELSAQDSSNSNKKRKTNILDNDNEIGHLDFESSTAQNTYLPMSLATQSVNDVAIEMPVVIQLKDGTSAILTTNINEQRVRKSFWVVYRGGIDDCHDHDLDSVWTFHTRLHIICRFVNALGGVYD